MRKKGFLFVLALIANYSLAIAQNAITVNDVEIPQSGQGTLKINFSLSETDKYQGYQFDLTLPNGITLVSDATNPSGYDLEKGSCHSASHSITINKIGNNYGFVCYSGSNATFLETSGTLLSLTLQADPSLVIGTENLEGELSTVKLGYTDAEGEKSELLANVSFDISIVEARMLLDENSTTPPVDADNVNVKVKRTIKANQWNTICLPFSMTESQVYDAFGPAVELADFNGCETTFDDNENVISIKVKFVAVTSIEANHPYVIKVADDISEFNVDGVDVSPEDEPSVDKDKTKIGKFTVYNRFVGIYNYTTLTDVEYVLFLNGGAFWYAPSQLTIKGYRGYFDFYDVLTSAENQSLHAPVRMVITDNNGNTTEIVNPDFIPVNDTHVYSINGIYVGEKEDIEKLPAGVYILNGEKFLVQ